MTRKMFPPKNILFPTDFSDRSAAVAPMAAEFVRRFDSNLTPPYRAPAPGGIACGAALADGRVRRH